jgi:hypothetical protein
MAAPKGNSFYLLRSKSGRNRKYNSDKTLLEACYDYFAECDSNPWYKNEAVKSGDAVGQIIKVPTARPYTLTGLFIFIGIDRKTWESYKSIDDFLPIITHVEDIIYTQKFEGAAVGAFNANIIARDLGLKDNTALEHSGSIVWNETKTYEK